MDVIKYKYDYNYTNYELLKYLFTCFNKIDNKTNYDLLVYADK